MIYEDIKNFGGQFEWRPEIEGGEKFGRFKKFVVVGLGGSNLAADLLKILRPDLDIIVHRDYGLPAYLEKNTLVILSSYSGNTEEVLDAYRAAGERDLPRLAVGAGGKLLELAKKENVPFIKFPVSAIQPRVALGFSFLALLRAVGDEELLEEAAGLRGALAPERLEEQGKKLAGNLRNFTPLVYTSHRNKGLSYAWKVILNETAKIPAFANVFPELNHNEMTGFSAGGGPASGGDFPTKNFYFIFLEDEEDDPRIAKRAAVTAKILGGKGFKVEKITLGGVSPLQKIFNSIILAHLTAYHLALNYGAEPEAVPLVEEFKNLIK